MKLPAILHRPGLRPVALGIAGAALAVSGLAGGATPAALADVIHVGTSVTTARPLFNLGPWTVVNSPGTWRNSPNINDTGAGLANGSSVTLSCYYFGGPAGQFSNTLWYVAESSNGTVGFVNDHYLNTPGTAAAPQPQAPHCSPSAGTGNVVSGSVNFTAENSPGTWDQSPSASDGSSIGISNGNTMNLACYYFGAAAGPFGNTLWYLAEDTTNHSFGWINDHYLNTPGTAAAPQPQTPHC